MFCANWTVLSSIDGAHKLVLCITLLGYSILEYSYRWKSKTIMLSIQYVVVTMILIRQFSNIYNKTTKSFTPSIPWMWHTVLLSHPFWFIFEWKTQKPFPLALIALGSMLSLKGMKKNNFHKSHTFPWVWMTVYMQFTKHLNLEGMLA